MLSPTLKRSRSDSAQPAPPAKRRVCQRSGAPAYERDREIWFPDGNLVIVAEGKAFKAYAGFLSKYSPTFREMINKLEAAQRPVASYDGVPVLKLNDKASQIKEMLVWMFSLPTTKATQRLQLSVVFTCYEMGQKYAIDKMHAEALSILDKCYPKSLFRWSLSSMCTNLGRMNVERPIAYNDHEAYEVAAFAARHSLDGIAAVALYDACQTQADDIARSIATVAKGIQKGEKVHGTDLSIWLQSRIFRGCASLSGARSRLIRQLSDMAAVEKLACKQPVVCSQAMKRCAETMANFKPDHNAPPGEEQMPTDILTIERHFRESPRPCDSCDKLRFKLVRDFQQEVWKQLPSYFGFTSEVLLDYF